MAAAERGDGPSPDDLAYMLRVFPQSSADPHWPEVWVRAARLLEPEQLEAIAREPEDGAFKLVEAGIRCPPIDRRLGEVGDYRYLTRAERRALLPYVSSWRRERLKSPWV